MNIKNWPIERIMQLPDCCFGRRWPVGVFASDTAVAIYYDISEAGLGDRCVVWNVTYFAGGGSTLLARISVALGDVIPTTDPQFDAMEPLFSDIGRRGALRRELDLGQFGMSVSLPMRLPVMAQGRRMVGRIEIVGAAVQPPSVIIEVSSFPTEVPEWLISGQGNYQ